MRLKENSISIYSLLPSEAHYEYDAQVDLDWLSDFNFHFLAFVILLMFLPLMVPVLRAV